MTSHNFIIYCNEQGKIKEDNKFLNRLYLTNNVSESINAKLNYYLPKRATNNKDFITSLSKIIINNIIKKSQIIRHDYISRSMIMMINNLKLNENPKWISYDEFYKYLQIIIKKNCIDETHESSEDSIIKIINRLEISEFNNKIEFYDNNKENQIKDSIFEEDRNNINCIWINT